MPQTPQTQLWPPTALAHINMKILPPNKLQDIARNGHLAMCRLVAESDFQKRLFNKGDTLFKQGEAFSKFYWVSTGIVTLSHTAMNGRVMSLGLIHANDRMFGEMEAFSGIASPFDVIAITGIDAVEISMNEMADILLANPAISIWLNTMLSSSYLAYSKIAANRTLFPLSYNIAMDIYLRYTGGTNFSFDQQYKEAERFGCSERVYLREIKKLLEMGAITRERGKVISVNAEIILRHIRSFE